MQSLRRLGTLQRGSFVLQGLTGELRSSQPAAVRFIGGGGIPEQWGQPETGGTKFLGTPVNYMEARGQYTSRFMPPLRCNGEVRAYATRLRCFCAFSLDS